MTRYFVAAPMGLAASLFLSTALCAEQWIQIEAQPSLTEATNSAQSYAARLPNVVGFELPGRWHAIAVGPYATEADAEAARQTLRSQGLIPRDSYLTDGGRFEEAFWPVGANLAALTAPPATPAPVAAEPNQEDPAVQEPTAQEPAFIEETKAQARASERALDRPAREALQTALKFAGFYKSGIDGAFGPGTRRAMADWQAYYGYDVTGVLTTSQRATVLAAYRTVIDSLALAPVVDDTAGISITLPLGLVEFDSYAPPFAKFKSKDGSGVQVMLISQTGDEATLGGLYEIMQTLEIVPMDGPRQSKGNSFSLTGTNANITSHTEARLANGMVKGWTLIWPTGDETRHKMALEAMKTSFKPVEGVLPDAYGDGAAQDIDLLAGLDIRRPTKAGTGFYVSETGAVLTDTDLVASCEKITFDGYDATVSASQDGMALLSPTQSLAPLSYAQFDSQLPRLQSEVSVAGFAYEGRLGAPTLNYGVMAEHQGLGGEQDLLRLAMTTLPGEIGGPLLNGAGAVIGMLAPQSTISEAQARALPEDVSFAYDMEKLAEFLSGQGVTVAASESSVSKSDAELVTLGRDLAVLVSCWN